MNPKRFLKIPFTIRAGMTRPHKSLCLSLFLVGMWSWLLVLPVTIKAQEITDNFDIGTDVGWQHYTPTTAGGAIPQYSFPTNDSGKGYRMVGPPLTCQGVLQRGGAYRSEQYSEFFYSVDLLNFDPLYSTYAIFGGRIGPPGNLAPLSTQGYMLAYMVGAPRQRQTVLANIEFTS